MLNQSDFEKNMGKPGATSLGPNFLVKNRGHFGDSTNPETTNCPPQSGGKNYRVVDRNQPLVGTLNPDTNMSGPLTGQVDGEIVTPPEIKAIKVKKNKFRTDLEKDTLDKYRGKIKKQRQRSKLSEEKRDEIRAKNALSHKVTYSQKRQSVESTREIGIDTTPKLAKKSISPKNLKTQLKLQNMWRKNDKAVLNEELNVAIIPVTPKSRFTESFKRKFDDCGIEDDEDTIPSKMTFIQSNSVQEVVSDTVQVIYNEQNVSNPQFIDIDEVDNQEEDISTNEAITENCQDEKLQELKNHAKQLFEESNSNIGRLRSYIQKEITNLKDRGWVESYYCSDDSEPDERDEMTKTLQAEKDNWQEDIMDKILALLPAGFAKGRRAVEFEIVHVATEEITYLCESETYNLESEVEAVEKFNKLLLDDDVEKWFYQENGSSVGECSEDESSELENEENLAESEVVQVNTYFVHLNEYECKWRCNLKTFVEDLLEPHIKDIEFIVRPAVMNVFMISVMMLYEEIEKLSRSGKRVILMDSSYVSRAPHNPYQTSYAYPTAKGFEIAIMPYHEQDSGNWTLGIYERREAILRYYNSRKHDISSYEKHVFSTIVGSLIDEYKPKLNIVQVRDLNVASKSINIGFYCMLNVESYLIQLANNEVPVNVLLKNFNILKERDRLIGIIAKWLEYDKDLYYYTMRTNVTEDTGTVDIRLCNASTEKLNINEKKRAEDMARKEKEESNKILAEKRRKDVDRQRKHRQKLDEKVTAEIRLKTAERNRLNRASLDKKDLTKIRDKDAERKRKEYEQMPEEKYNVVLNRNRNAQAAIRQSHFTRIRRSYWRSYNRRDGIGNWFNQFEGKYRGERKGCYIRNILAAKMPKGHDFTEQECERIAQLIEKENDLYSQKDMELIAKFDALNIEKKFYRSSEQIAEYRKRCEEARLEKIRKIKENREALENEPLPDEENTSKDGSLHDEEQPVPTEEEDLEWLEREMCEKYHEFENEKS
ncbi:hypothetical protein Ddc_14066 [Ditylenchus destructor]|nr:hypothetical protein Ddc_14066 [Ditylenchus destructor]